MLKYTRCILRQPLAYSKSLTNIIIYNRIEYTFSMVRMQLKALVLISTIILRVIVPYTSLYLLHRGIVRTFNSVIRD